MLVLALLGIALLIFTTQAHRYLTYTRVNDRLALMNRVDRDYPTFGRTEKQAIMSRARSYRSLTA